MVHPAPESQVSAIFELMADWRCRIALEYLRDRVDVPVAEETLVRHLVAVETDAWSGAVPPEYPQYVEEDLLHSVLPALAHQGLIDYDPSTGTIRYHGDTLLDGVLRSVPPTISN